MVVRADFGRGLAHQTRSFHDALKPDVTVAVDISPLDPRGLWPQDFDAYPGAIRTTWRGYTAPFDNDEALEALETCDVVYSAETYYDDRLPKLTKTVLHVNPEFYRHEHATQYWYPTDWRIGDLPPGQIVPTPIPDGDIALDLPGSDRLLHVGGHRAKADRNGANVVSSVVNQIRHPWRLTSQDGMRLNPRVMGYVEAVGFTADRWALYDGCGILVYPRRYGGQSLVVNEAMARGLAVVMPSCSPNITAWPTIPVPAKPSGFIQTPGGKLQMYLADPRALRDTIVTLISDREMLERWQARSLAWARDTSWSVWLPEIRRLLDAC